MIRIFVLLTFLIAAFYSGGLVYADTTAETADFRIIAVNEHDKHLVVEVEHFKPNGDFDYFENYLWEGREGTKFPRAVNEYGLALLKSGPIAPGRMIPGTMQMVQYLPPNEEWQLEETPFLDKKAILSVIQDTHNKRKYWTPDDWPENIKRGQSRLLEPELPFNAQDSEGINVLVSTLSVLKDSAYKTQSNGDLRRHTGILPPVHLGEGRIEYGTVSTFYPSLDGRLGTNVAGAGAVWSTLYNGAGTSADYTASTFFLNTNSTSTTNQFGSNFRDAVLFDTSAIGSAATVTNATLEVVVTSVVATLFADTVGIGTSDPASTSALVSSDYANSHWTSTRQATDIAVSSLTADSSTYNVFTLNATGKGNINKTGITKFSLRYGSDLDGTGPTWTNNNLNAVTFASAEEILPGDKRPRLVVTHVTPTAAVSGTIGDGATEQEVREGAGTIVLTLTDDTWVAAGGTFDSQRSAIIQGLDAADAQTNGWNAEVRDKLGVGSVIRTSDTVVTITISASDVTDYDITTNEVITATVPAAALTTSTGDMTATPTFTILAGTESVALTGTISDGATSTEIKAGGETAIITLANTTWVASGSDFNAQRQNIINGFVSTSSDANGWNVRRADFPVADVIRTSDTVVTIEFSAASDYSVGSAETVTLTVPASAISYGSPLTATPTFTITPRFATSGTWVSPAIDLSGISALIYCSIGWEQTTPTSTNVSIEYSIDGGNTYASATNGSCPFTLDSSLVSISDFRIKASLSTEDNTATPSITAIGFVAGDVSGQTVRYRLNTTPGLTITDRSGNGHAGTMSFPLQPTGVETTVGSMNALRESASAQISVRVPQMTSPVTGAAVSDNLFNLDETGWAELPGYSIVNSMATAGDGLPIQFVWYIFLGFLIIMGGFFALNLTNSLFASATTMGVGIGAALAIGGGLMPGWVIFVFLPIAIGLIFLRPRLAI